MADELFGFNAAEAAVLRRMVAEYRGDATGPPRGLPRPGVDWDGDPPAPEVYVARAPPGGLPAAEDDGTPGTAYCDVYRLPDGGPPESAGFTRLIHNLGSAAVDENGWLMVVREKYGRWVATAAGSGGGTTVAAPCPVYASAVRVTASALMTTDHYLYEADATAGAVTLTLPVRSPGLTWCVVKVDASSNTVTVACQSGDTVSGSSTRVISARWTAVDVDAGTAGWIIH